jgi:prevent-host-death family protein
MQGMTIGDFKTHFSEVLKKVQQGESIQVLYGRAKTPVAVLGPVEQKKAKKTSGK